MSTDPFRVIDCDGHLVESIAELAEYMGPALRNAVIHGERNREGAFPSLDGYHGPRAITATAPGAGGGREYVQASTYRKGSSEDFLAFMDRANVEQAVMFASEGLSVGLIRSAESAVQICRAFNDYVYDKYTRQSDRLHVMALIPFQSPRAAVEELRRAVKDLGLPGAMVPATGLPVHIGHEYYWPIYEEAADLDCVLGVHGGSTQGTELDTFSVPGAKSSLHHSMALMAALTSLTGHGVLDRFSPLRVGFFEGGCGWMVPLLDRIKRGEEVTGRSGLSPLPRYIDEGRILVGCEGNEPSLPYLMSCSGPGPYAWASDYPHEVDLDAAKFMISETVARSDLSDHQKAAVLAESARRFFRLTEMASPVWPQAAAGAVS
jgi:predicted TIM-barrel fold metal-dependent hydrolase